MATLTCIICNGSNANLCSSCRSISYCSPECQKSDWPLHKTICKAFTTLPLRPFPSHKLAILLPIDSKDPQLIWIKCERCVDDEDGIAWENPDTQHLLEIENLDPEYHAARQFLKIKRNALRGFNLSYTVEVIGREAALIDGSTPNICVLHNTKGQTTHVWRGPMVVMRQPGTAIDPLFYEDIKASDFRVAIDYFLSYGRGL
ncbi:Zinc finger MYND-type protein [Rutstroemia sp. NJR-2017a BVV2]|nr:Zinc finger MYND-type protein [Rutstroemia sp. NJR-2017a BVV2]